MTDATACEVPLTEQLRQAPVLSRLVINDGEYSTTYIPYSTTYIPVGVLMHKAADLIDAQAAEIERLRGLLRIEQDLALRNDPFRCQQIECEWFGRRVRAGDCQCHHLQATEHRAKVCKALDAARGTE